MSRTVVIRVFAAAVLCLAMTAPPLWAKPVMRGALDICESVDGGTSTTVDGTEVCCAREAGLDNAPPGPYYCVECDPPGSNNCDIWYASKAPGDRVVTILLSTILTEHRGLQSDMLKVLSRLDSLQTQIDKGLCPAPTK